MKKSIQRLFLFIILFFNLVTLLPNHHVFGNFDQSYITVVIPFRGREYWSDINRIKPLFDYLVEQNIPSTILLQYQNLNDREVIDYIKRFPNNFEIGLFLEVDESLANDSFSSFLYGIGDKAHANQILLSGYNPVERKRMIDQAFFRFRQIFNTSPKSVGAWYLDTVSLNYLKIKYDIKAVLDVADQYQTDTYGLWGKPWGVAYLPSKYNSLLPAQNKQDNMGIVKIQWAARDPLSGYGLTVNHSTYSVQANDYVKAHRLDVDYFKHLSGIYLSSANSINQLTIGLEAGQEGYTYLDEFKKQIAAVSWAEFVTMEDFAETFLQSPPKSSVISGPGYLDNSRQGYWFNYPRYRAYFVREGETLIFKDLRIYDPPFFFNDVFYKQTGKNLNLIVPACLDGALTGKNLIIARNIRDLRFTRLKDRFFLEFVANNKKNQLLLTPDDIVFNSRRIFISRGNFLINNFLIRNFYDLILAIQTGRPDNLKITPLFSRIDNVYYFGLPFYPDKLLGIKSRWPFLGIFNFPFQVLSKFKTVDFDKFLFFYAPDFINPAINCQAVNRLSI
ncbi:hypothetical protein A3D78_05550 [Candidatus Gottesmanbacteria bacterium RIFCSPHIGHO2_02_FULL_39_14]|uniref:Uncharacterized protein n=2 Tax=Candidatus Gottesmaniibacteriota TaxID=1752720 RepID=A0A1F5ZXX0_9BACT|nr:MAG: hypothetical protein A3D78_05550 [Candidatus Gottesmanbacteria bacterium RIFCSPHIGHO2_02_FULL_39_14]OGG31143.1 MAG: hypothetical protein A3I51_00970 [Candidatus Gottesmanbacteria bacterium RIFCSPLOWO2_02_FULL_38_8]